MDANKTLIVINGVTGDLSRTKLVPALQQLYAMKKLPHPAAIVGTGRRDLPHNEFLNLFDLDNEEFQSHFYYYQGIKGLKKHLETNWEFDQIIFFLALPPHSYEKTVEELYNEGFKDNVRLIIEKPFGYDFASAKKLNEHILRFFNEEQVYRIDHYLAKEAIQNILVFRFTNTIFQPIWNYRYISSIQINATETDGIRDRGPYFDSAGIIRDMVQNHLIQLLCLLTMDAPSSLEAEDIRVEKLSVLKTLKVEESRLFQYEGYLDENGVENDSRTETFAEIQMSINNFRWHGVPVFIRTGKAAERKGIEIGINFKKQPPILFNTGDQLDRNRIIFKVQPSAGIIIDMTNKVPGGDFQITNANMAFCYRDLFAGGIPDAYLKLLIDAINGDRTLFVSAEETELAWQVVQPALDNKTLKTYPRGSSPGPEIVREWIPFEKYKDLC